MAFLQYNFDMIAEFNKIKLNKILETFNTLTNANVCVFSPDFTPLASFGEVPCYCAQIRKNPTLHANCLASDKAYANECCAKRTSLTYTCHAGIVETISPIFFEGILLGYVIFGGLRDDENEYSNEQTIAEFCKKANLDYDEYCSYYKKLPSFTHKQLDAYIEILKLCIKNILSENLLKPNASLFSSKILSYIQEHFTEDIKVRDVCSTVGASEKTVYKILHDTVGQTINGYITFLRIEKAKTMLSSTDLSVSSIATQVGYNDYNYFIRLFRKETSITPLKFRKQHSII